MKGFIQLAKSTVEVIGIIGGFCYACEETYKVSKKAYQWAFKKEKDEAVEEAS